MGITVLLLSAWGRTRVKYLAKHIVKLKSSSSNWSNFTDAMSFAMHHDPCENLKVQQKKLSLVSSSFIFHEEDQTKLLKLFLELLKP